MYICGCIHYEEINKHDYMYVYRKLYICPGLKSHRIVEIAEPAASECKFRCYVLIPHCLIIIKK